MLIYKGLSAIAAAALGAAIIVALPGFSPEVEAGAPAPVVKSERLDIPSLANGCAQQTWPYYEARCLRSPGARARPVRLVTTARLPSR